MWTKDGVDESWQAVSLSGLELDLEVGVFEHEHGRRQKVRLDVTLYRRHKRHVGGLEACLDYDGLLRAIDEHLGTRHVELLEDLAEQVLDLGFADRRVERCRVRIAKPEVFGGRSIPTLEVWRTREDHD